MATFSIRDSLIRLLFRNSSFSKYFPDISQTVSFTRSGQPSEILLSSENLWDLYTQIPHLNIVINTRADLFSQGKLKLTDKNGNEVENHRILDLLNKPNPTQSKQEFLTSYLVFKDIYGNIPILKNPVLQSQPIPSQLWNLPPANFKIKTTGKLWRQTSINDIIEYYELQEGAKITRFTPEEIILKNDNLGGEYIISESKLKALIKPLSNIEAALRTANVLTNDHGMYGIISSKKSDGAGNAIPFAGKEKEQVEAAASRRYGNKPGQAQIAITSAEVTYTPIGANVKDMLLNDEIEQDFGIIIGAYGLDRDMFPSEKGATYENKKQARIGVIQNTIQSEADDFCNTINNEFRLYEEGLTLSMSYGHLPIMQIDNLAKEQAEKVKAEKLHILYSNNIINAQTFADEMGITYTGNENTTNAGAN